MVVFGVVDVEHDVHEDRQRDHPEEPFQSAPGFFPDQAGEGNETTEGVEGDDQGGEAVSDVP